MSNGNISTDNIEYLRTLVAQARLREAFEILATIESEFKNEIILTSSRYSHLMTKVDKGTIAEPTEILELNKITSALLNILGKIENEVRVVNTPKKDLVRINKKNLKAIKENSPLREDKLIKSIEEFVRKLSLGSSIEIENPKFEKKERIEIISDLVKVINDYRLKYDDFDSKLDPEVSTLEKTELFYNSYSEEFINQFSGIFNQLESEGLGLRIYETPEPVGQILQKIIVKNKNYNKSLLILSVPLVVLAPFSLPLIFGYFISKGIVLKPKAFRLVVFEKRETNLIRINTKS